MSATPRRLALYGYAHGEEVEAEMDVVAPVISSNKAAEAAEPSAGSLNLLAV
ncbi:hypothetical protein [Muricoccus nepalensis]|uniref:hypothetical protein n=1 Tax=Muricoccus nepalensis TaxID=1854500 RepID=UPI001386C6E5|nr:hypothetical protein [Roseomonas nepalensis]